MSMTEIPHQRYFNFALILPNIVSSLTGPFRPQHLIYESKDKGLLYENGILFNLAIFIMRETFSDCNSIEDLLTKQPNEGEDISIISRKKTVLDKPVYPSICRNGVEITVSISKRIRELGFRAGFIYPPRPHDFRAGSLIQVGM